jgi:hypothetical protein
VVDFEDGGCLDLRDAMLRLRQSLSPGAHDELPSPSLRAPAPLHNTMIVLERRLSVSTGNGTVTADQTISSIYQSDSP